MLNINKKLDYYTLGIDLVKIAFVVHLPNGKWRVKSHKGKNLGTYNTKEEAVKRLRQVEFFKHHKGSAEITSTYTEIARDLNTEPDELKNFQTIFKKNFDEAYLNNDDSPEEIALNKTMEE